MPDTAMQNLVYFRSAIPHWPISPTSRPHLPDNHYHNRNNAIAVLLPRIRTLLLKVMRQVVEIDENRTWLYHLTIKTVRCACPDWDRDRWEMWSKLELIIDKVNLRVLYGFWWYGKPSPAPQKTVVVINSVIVDVVAKTISWKGEKKKGGQDHFEEVCNGVGIRQSSKN